MNFAEALLLGSLQGVVEWLPVSSEGLVTAVYSLVWGGDLFRSGWILAVAAPWHGHIRARSVSGQKSALLTMDVLRSPRSPGPLTRFFVVATIVSAPIGFLLLVGLEGFSERAGGAGNVSRRGIHAGNGRNSVHRSLSRETRTNWRYMVGRRVDGHSARVRRTSRTEQVRPHPLRVTRTRN